MTEQTVFFNVAVPMWAVASFQVSTITLALLNRWEAKEKIEVADSLGNLLDELKIQHEPALTTDCFTRKLSDRDLELIVRRSRISVIKTFQAWTTGALGAAGFLLGIAFWLYVKKQPSIPEITNVVNLLLGIAMVLTCTCALLTLALAAGIETWRALINAVRQLVDPRKDYEPIKTA